MSNVRMILATREYASFTEAEPHAVTSVTDGDDLWMYLKFPGPAAESATVRPGNTDQWGRTYASFKLGIGPGDQDGEDDWNERDWTYVVDDLQGDEIIKCLSPGVPGGDARNDWLFVDTVANGAPGYWENSLRLFTQSNWDEPKVYLAVAPITVDVRNGMDGYARIARDFHTNTTRGVAEENRLPMPGRFVDLTLARLAVDCIRNKGIEPEKFFFSSDAWTMTFDSGQPNWNTVDGVFLYRRDGEPMFGTMQVGRHFAVLTETWTDPEAYAIDPGYPITEDAYAAAPGGLAPSAGSQAGEAGDDLTAGGYRLRVLPDGTAEVTMPTGGQVVVRQA